MGLRNVDSEIDERFRVWRIPLGWVLLWVNVDGEMQDERSRALGVEM